MIRALFGGIGLSGWITLIMAATICGLVIAKQQADRQRGAADERGRIERASRAAEDKADAATRRVLDCPAGKWNREAGRCTR